MKSEIPSRKAIELLRYYEEFASYYPKCELQTKKWFVENAKENWVYVDAGANVGIYSILFSQLSPDGLVYAFEPTETAVFLVENLQANQCANVRVFRNALGNKSGKIEDKVFRIWGQEPEVCKQPFTTVDDFCSSEKIDRLDCIKIDVDSYDLEVLEGSISTLRQFNPYIVVELNHALAKRNRSNSEAFEFLAKQGYEQALVLEHENFVLKKGISFNTPAQLILKYG
jgi:FkbM family methyltransferase